MTEDLLKSLMEISQMMIEAGAEVNRVEESAERICLAYGARRADVYVTTFNVIISVEDENGAPLTNTRRIEQTSTNIEKLHKLNALVRRMCERRPALTEVEREIDSIRATPSYPAAVVILFYGVIAAAFSLFFGGRTFGEIAVSFVTGSVVGAFSIALDMLNINKLLSRFLCSSLAAICAFMSLRAGFIPRVDMVIIGNIMSLIPGIGLTNSLRDLFTGNSITGILRSIETILLALAIACGYILVAYLFGGVL